MAAEFDAVVIGAGAGGLMCAGMAGQRGLRVLLIDHATKVAEKIRISGGGRCNFTNRETTPANFLSDNPAFCRSALAGYAPDDFIVLLRRHRISWHEKHKGQLFCDESSAQVIEMLLRECDAGGVVRWQPCEVQAIRLSGDEMALDTTRGPVRAGAVVVATGGLSIPQLGASDFGYQLARQFDHAVVEPRPALVPLTFATSEWQPFAALAGLSCEVRIDAGVKPRCTFTEDLLFTHRGLSGPAVLQASSYWRKGQSLRIALADADELRAALVSAKARSRRSFGNELAQRLPQRLAETWLRAKGLNTDTPIPEVRDKDIARLADGLARWEPTPSGSEGWRKAEVTAGGVDTRELSSRTMQSRRVPGLYFIGEVVDVTGWLGGYNFQWAWASAVACARSLKRRAAANAPGSTSMQS
ncbi:MAG: NAD(P)/FAD-dependent oxidoreductase [Burkholderiales bacterium]